ncbi:hypothetical protein OROGR_007510 [Orobanche gracilis]
MFVGGQFEPTYFLIPPLFDQAEPPYRYVFVRDDSCVNHLIETFITSNMHMVFEVSSTVSDQAYAALVVVVILHIAHGNGWHYIRRSEIRHPFRIDIGDGDYYLIPPRRQNGQVVQNGQVLVLADRCVGFLIEYVIDTNAGPVDFVFNRNLSEAAFTRLSMAIMESGGMHGLRRSQVRHPLRMDMGEADYYLYPPTLDNSPPPDWRTVAVRSDVCIPFLIEHFVNRNTYGPVRFIVNRSVSQVAFLELEFSIIYALAEWRRYHSIERSNQVCAVMRLPQQS